MSEARVPQRVLVVAKAYPPEVGGVESYSEHVARAYLARGLEPIVVTSWKGALGWHDIRYPEGVIRILNVGASSQPIVFIRLFLVCTYIRLMQKFDFIHATTWRPALAVMPFRALTPIVLTVHGQEVFTCPKVQRFAMNWVLGKADLIITVSDSILKIAKEVVAKANVRGEWRVCYNGLSYLDEARNHVRPVQPPDETIQILSFCRLVERKNIAGCLVALAQLRDVGVTNFSYTIAGTGPLELDIKAQIRALGLQGVVKMTGYVKEHDIINLYRDADIFLHPQVSTREGRDLEGFGLVIADAMSFGAAVIVGKEGGPADFVAHGERGLVVDGGDFDAVAVAVDLLLLQPELRQRLAQEGRNWCLANLSWDRHVGQILESLNEKQEGQPTSDHQINQIADRPS